MVRMIPEYPREGANISERKVFNTLEATNQRGELVYHAELVGFSKLRDYKMPLTVRLLLALTRLPVLGKVLTHRAER